jgi:hypothetical protein
MQRIKSKPLRLAFLLVKINEKINVAGMLNIRVHA